MNLLSDDIEYGAEDSLLESLGGTSVEETCEEESTSTTAPSSHYSPGITSSIEQRALTLLGAGVSGEATAAALGVTPARIAQLLADENFSSQVAQLRYAALQKHNVRDSRYDSVEDKLLDKLEKSMPLMFKPEIILKAITTINGAKRRGVSSPEHVTNNQNIVNLVLPTTITQRFTARTNLDNQVINAGGQDLLTMPAGNLLKQVEAAKEARTAQLTTDASQPQEQEEESCQQDTDQEEFP